MVKGSTFPVTITGYRGLLGRTRWAAIVNPGRCPGLNNPGPSARQSHGDSVRSGVVERRLCWPSGRKGLGVHIRKMSRSTPFLLRPQTNRGPMRVDSADVRLRDAVFAGLKARDYSAQGNALGRVPPAIRCGLKGRDTYQRRREVLLARRNGPGKEGRRWRNRCPEF